MSTEEHTDTQLYTEGGGPMAMEHHATDRVHAQAGRDFVSGGNHRLRRLRELTEELAGSTSPAEAHQRQVWRGEAAAIRCAHTRFLQHVLAELRKHRLQTRAAGGSFETCDKQIARVVGELQELRGHTGVVPGGPAGMGVTLHEAVAWATR